MEKNKPKKALKVAVSREHNSLETGDISRPLELQHGKLAATRGQA